MQKQMPCDHFSYSIWPVLFGRILNSCLANYSAPMQVFGTRCKPLSSLTLQLHLRSIETSASFRSLKTLAFL